MATSLYKLYQEFEKMDIPKGYKVTFEFDDKARIIIRVSNIDSLLAFAWAVTPKELELYKLDFVKEHIHAMVEEIEMKIKENEEC